MVVEHRRGTGEPTCGFSRRGGPGNGSGTDLTPYRKVGGAVRRRGVAPMPCTAATYRGTGGIAEPKVKWCNALQGSDRYLRV